MATIKRNQIELVAKLYLEQKLSAQEIAKELEVSLNAVYYFLRKHKIPRRGAGDNSNIRFTKKPLSFKLKTSLTKKEDQLKLSACLLYWCEGYKTERSSGVDFANSDPHMVQIFLRFLRQICRVDEGRIKVLLYCHDNTKTTELINYWSNELEIPKDQFTRPYVVSSGNLEKKSKMPYGLVHIRYYDKKLLAQILEWIEELKK